ncbi:MAG: hypothetical protein EBS42_16960, partial [Caulobacteraceae bacterium]|nr:hypothetical protein [Caulobacteraceae bacterium]
LEDEAPQDRPCPYQAAKVVYEAVAAADRADRGYDPNYFTVGRAELALLEAPAPNLAAVIEKLEIEEARADSMSIVGPDGEITGLTPDGSSTDLGRFQRPRGFRCAAWVRALETGLNEDRAHLAVFRDLCRLAGMHDHPALVSTVERDLPVTDLQLAIEARGWIENFTYEGGRLHKGPDGEVWIGRVLESRPQDEAAQTALLARLTPELKAAVAATLQADWGQTAASRFKFSPANEQEPV